MNVDLNPDDLQSLEDDALYNLFYNNKNTYTPAKVINYFYPKAFIDIYFNFVEKFLGKVYNQRFIKPLPSQAYKFNQLSLLLDCSSNQMLERDNLVKILDNIVPHDFK